MLRMLTVTLLVAVATGCPGGGGGGLDKPDAAPPPPPPDAPKPPPPPDAQLRGYGQSCTSPNQCASGLCVGETGGSSVCSIPCNIEVANDCRSVDAFCVPIGGGDNACFGMIETLNDLDDAILSVGDSATRVLTPLNDADMFQVKLNQLGKIRFTVTPQPSIDVKLEAYGMIGSPLGVSNDAAAGGIEVLETDVQQIGAHVFLVVRNVGQSTGGYTFNVTKVTALAPSTARTFPARDATSLSRSSADDDSSRP
jgi:hypothetical protein